MAMQLIIAINKDIFSSLTLSFLYSLLFIIASDLAVIDDHHEIPTFVESLPNVTVALGRDASLNCIVNKLGSHKVSIFLPFTD